MGSLRRLERERTRGYQPTFVDHRQTRDIFDQSFRKRLHQEKEQMARENCRLDPGKAWQVEIVGDVISETEN